MYTAPIITVPDILPEEIPPPFHTYTLKIHLIERIEQ